MFVNTQLTWAGFNLLFMVFDIVLSMGFHALFFNFTNLFNFNCYVIYFDKFES